MCKKPSPAASYKRYPSNGKYTLVDRKQLIITKKILKHLPPAPSAVSIYFLFSTCDKCDKRYSFKNIGHHRFSALYWPQIRPKKRCKDGAPVLPLNLHGPLVHHAIRRRRPPRSMITRFRPMHEAFCAKKVLIFSQL